MIYKLQNAGKIAKTVIKATKRAPVSSLDKIPIGKRVFPIMRTVQDDLTEMNKYHQLNVDEYNKTFGTNIQSIPFRTEFPINPVKTIPRDEFEALIDVNNTNSPNKNIENIGGYYSKKDDQVVLPNTAKSSAVYHEFEHMGQYGLTNPEVTRGRIEQLVDPEKTANMTDNAKTYFLSEEEFPVHLRQYGENLGIGIGDPYPGDIEFDKLLEENGIGGASTFVKRTTSEEKRLMGRAMNGTLFASLPFVSTLFGIQKDKNGGVIKLQKAGTKIPRVLRKAIKGFGETVDKTTFVPAQVKYYGPTMGKSYAAKTNPNLIDLDIGGRSEYDQLAKKYGYKDWREMILSDKGDYNEEYKQLIKDQIRRIQSDPQYSGKTIVVSNASLLKPNSGITFANTPVIPERSVMAVRNTIRHPGESIEHGEEGGDSLQRKGTPLKIDNRFISDIEGSKELIHVPKITIPDVRTYHLVDSSMPIKKQGGILKAQNGLQSITAQSDATRVAKTPEPEFGVPPEDLTNEEDNVDNVKYNPYNDKYVREFFDYDVLPRYMRENPNATAEEIEAVKNAYTDPQLIGKLKKDTLGMAKGGDKGGFLGIPFSLNRHAKYNSKYKLNRPTLVHENTHLYRQGVLGHIGIGKTTYPFKGLYAPNVYGLYRGSGYTPKEASYLQNAYNLDGFSFGYHGNNEKHFKLIESGTTNAEVRYRLGKELYDKTGKRPTIDELDNYIKNYSGDLGDLVGNSNAYGEKAQMNMMEDYFNTLNPNRENRTFEEERRIIEERKEELDQKEQEGNDKLKDALIHVADNGTIDQIPQNTTYGRKGGILKAQKGTFENFGNTLPENQRDSTDFNVRRYWELNGKPFDFKEAIRKGMYKKEKDGYHANSIAFNEETGEYEFMKSPNHPTINFELDGYNSPKAKKFRNKYQLDTTSIPGKYILKQQQGGFITPITNQFTTKLMEFLEKYRRKGPAPQKAVGPAV